MKEISSPLPEPLPDELINTLRRAAPTNPNYNITALGESVKRDIRNALLQEDGTSRSERVAEQRIHLLCAGISARVASILRVRKQSKEQREHGGRLPPLVTMRRLSRSLTNEADRAPQNGFSIDPAKLPDMLVENLGLGHLLAPKGSTKLEQLHAKADCTRYVEAVLLSIEPLSVKSGRQGVSNRLFRITKGKKQGHILGLHKKVSRKGEGGGAKNASDRFSVYDLYGAERHVSHVHTNYIVERGVLAEINTDVNILYDLLSQQWEETRTPEILQGHIDTLTGYVAKLRFVKDDDKRKLRGVIRIARECLVKKNPGATLATLTRLKIQDFIGNRLEAMDGIIGELFGDKGMLQSRIKEEETVVERLHRTVEGGGIDPHLAHPEMPFNYIELNNFRQQLHFIRNACAREIVLEPNRSFAKKLEEALQLTMSALERKQPEGPDRKGAAEMFMRAFVISKLARFYHFLMKFYEKFSVGDAVDFDLRKKQESLAQATDAMNDRETAPTTYTPEFNALWMEIRELMKTLSAAMESFDATTVETIKTSIANFDLPGKVAAVQLGVDPGKKQVDKPGAQA